jgi:hypothetical protein
MAREAISSWLTTTVITAATAAVAVVLSAPLLLLLLLLLALPLCRAPHWLRCLPWRQRRQLKLCNYWLSLLRKIRAVAAAVSLHASCVHRCCCNL